MQFDLFGVPWPALSLPDLRKFLEEAGEEGLTWEAKGAGVGRSAPHPDSIQKAACGFANQIGGYLIVGASEREGAWCLDGIEPPSGEPGHWVSQVIRSLRPVPPFEVSEVFKVAEDRSAFVVRIEPIAIPPCMTAKGLVFERVSTETVPVNDPPLLDRLLRRGDFARGRAENFARRAAERAIDLPDWPHERSVAIAVGLASVGRETDDISSRLFVEPTHEAIVKSIWALLGDVQPEDIDIRQGQDAYTAVAHSPRNTHFEVGGAASGIARGSYFLQANWDGSVGAGAWFGDELLGHAVHPEQMISTAWEQAAGLLTRLGGYGPTHLRVLIGVAKSGEVEVRGKEARIPGRPPPASTLYSKLPKLTSLGRMLDSAAPDEQTIDSLRRELQRAAGIRADEPG